MGTSNASGDLRGREYDGTLWEFIFMQFSTVFIVGMIIGFCIITFCIL